MLTNTSFGTDEVTASTPTNSSKLKNLQSNETRARSSDDTVPLILSVRGK
jgi:hypothetical protein